VPSIGARERRAGGFNSDAVGRSTVVSRRSLGGSAAGSAHALPSVPVAASRRGGAYGDSTDSAWYVGAGAGGGAGEAAVAAVASVVSGREGRGGATIVTSENDARVMPISRCLARRMRGNTTPKIVARSSATPGIPIRRMMSEAPTRRCADDGWVLQKPSELLVYTSRASSSHDMRHTHRSPSERLSISTLVGRRAPPQLRLPGGGIRFPGSGKGL